MNNVVSFIVAALVATAAGTAAAQAQLHADEPAQAAEPALRAGRHAQPFYVSLALGGAEFTVNPGEPGAFAASDFAGAYRLGVRLERRLSIEGFVQNFAYANALFSRVFSRVASSPDLYPTQHVGVAVVGTLPLVGRMAAYGRLGLGGTAFRAAGHPERDTSLLDPSIGLGLTLGSLRGIDLRLEATRFMHSDITTRQLVGELRF